MLQSGFRRQLADLIAACDDDHRAEQRRRRRDSPATGCKRTPKQIKRADGERKQQRIAGCAALRQHDNRSGHRRRYDTHCLEQRIFRAAACQQAHHAQAERNHARAVIMHACPQIAILHAEHAAARSNIQTACCCGIIKQTAAPDYSEYGKQPAGHRQHISPAFLACFGNRRIDAEEHRAVAKPCAQIIERHAKPNGKRHDQPHVEDKQRHHVAVRPLGLDRTPLESEQAKRRAPRHDDKLINSIDLFLIPAKDIRIQHGDVKKRHQQE